MATIPTNFDLLAGADPIRTAMRGHDWSASSLGHPANWESSLRNATALILDAQFPMFLAWGPQLAFLYNTAYAPLLDERHPHVIGTPLREVWPEIWPDIAHLVERTLDGLPSFGEDVARTLRRHGRPTRCWFTLSYSPVRDDAGEVAGVLCIIRETTARVLLERRQAFQLQLADGLRGLGQPRDIIARASDVIARNLDVRQVLFADVNAQRNSVSFHAVHANPAGVERAGGRGFLPGAQRTTLAVFGDDLARLQEGRSVVHDDAATGGDAESLDRVASMLAKADFPPCRARIAVPVVRNGMLAGVLVVAQAAPRSWSAAEIGLVEDAAERTWEAIARARAQTALQRSELSLKNLTATLEEQVAARTHERDRIWRMSMDLLLAIGPDGVLRSVNPAWTITLGYARDELENHYFEPFVHPDDVAATVEAIGAATRGPLDHFEVRLRHTDGTYRWFAWRAAPENGMVYANGRDITVEKRQAALLEASSQARLNLALEAGAMGAWEWNPGLAELRWLHGMPALHGMQADDQNAPLEIKDYLRRFVHPDDRQSLATLLVATAAEGLHLQAEYRIVPATGPVQWIEARGQMLFDQDGQPSQMVGVCVNVTQRKRVERDLLFLARASDELAHLVDPAETLNRLASLAVPAFADWCTVDLLQPDSKLERVAVAHVDPERVRLAHDLHRRFPPDPQRLQGPWRVIDSGRTELVAELTEAMLDAGVEDPEYREALRTLAPRSYIAVPLSVRGKMLGVATFIGAESGRLYGVDDVLLAEDLARRVAVAIENAELYRSLREADQAKDVFLATLAHELRNPLAAIVGGVTMARLAGNDAQRLSQYIRLIDRQSAHLSRLVDDLLDVSRITTGKIQLKKEPLSLAAVLNGAIEAARARIAEAQLKLVVKLPGEATDLAGDPVRLAQVFANLLTNAAKFTPAGGEVHVGLACSPVELTVSVRDTGIGIAPDMLDTVFKLFAQAVHPIERNQGGMGIGLSLVDGLVRLHGGRVEVRSAGIGQGAEFLVHLPRMGIQPDLDAQHLHALPASLSAGTSQSQGRRILLVDDNVDATIVVSEMLSMLGHQVTVVHDGLAAVEAARTVKPDIIILDIGLPGIDGYEAARRIRAQPHLRSSTLMIALTGWGQDGDRQRALDAGFDQHLVKPVSFEQLGKITSS